MIEHSWIIYKNDIIQIELGSYDLLLINNDKFSDHYMP